MKMVISLSELNKNPYKDCLSFAGATVLDMLTIGQEWIAFVEMGKQKGFILGTMPTKGIIEDIETLGNEITVENLTAIGDHYLGFVFNAEQAKMANADRYLNADMISKFQEFVDKYKELVKQFRKVSNSST